MQGRSLASDMMVNTADDSAYDEGEEEIIRKRLSGLGYIS
jgi:hypothetical protein